MGCRTNIGLAAFQAGSHGVLQHVVFDPHAQCELGLDSPSFETGLARITKLFQVKWITEASGLLGFVQASLKRNVPPDFRSISDC